MFPSHTRRSVLPGFGLTMGYTVLYLSLVVIIPLAAQVIKCASLGWDAFWASAWTPRVVASYKLTMGSSLFAAVVNAFFGFLVAWWLVRYTIPGK
jgi:sulfate transport system permease protein